MEDGTNKHLDLVKCGFQPSEHGNKEKHMTMKNFAGSKPPWVESLIELWSSMWFHPLSNVVSCCLIWGMGLVSIKNGGQHVECERVSSPSATSILTKKEPKYVLVREEGSS